MGVYFLLILVFNVFGYLNFNHITFAPHFQLPTRLATIKFDEEDDVAIGASVSNNEKENVHQISQSTSNIKHFTEPGNYISTEVGSGAATATSMQGPGESR